MIKKIIASCVLTVAAIAGLVLANPHGGHDLSSLASKIPVVDIDLGGLKALLMQPPIPIVRLPTLHLPPHHGGSWGSWGHGGGSWGHGGGSWGHGGGHPLHNIPIPVLSLPDPSSLLNSILGSLGHGGGSSWGPWA